MFCAQNRVIFFIICHFSMKWCVALCVFHDISQIFHDNGFLLVVLLACFFLCVFRLRFCLCFCLYSCVFLLEVSCLRVFDVNWDNGDNGLILNSMLSGDNNKYNFYQPKGWLPLENFWRGLFDGQGWLSWLARLTILACKSDYFGLQDWLSWLTRLTILACKIDYLGV